MEKRQLLIGIPTKDHPKHIRYLLSQVLPDAKRYLVDIQICDSSSNDATKDIVEKRIEQGYTNLFYKRYPEKMMSWEKVKDIYINSGYEYVWLCGDGIVIRLEECIEIIEEEIRKKRNMIVFSYDDEQRYMEITDSLSLMENCWDALTLWGDCIISGELFHSEEWNYYMKKYENWIYVAAYFEKFSKHPLNAAYIKCGFCRTNPFKESSTWVLSGMVLELMKDYIHTVDVLPGLYASIKWRCAKTIIDFYLNPGTLWVWRLDGNLDFRKALVYGKIIKKFAGINLCKVLLVSICPRKPAGLLCTLFGKKSTIYKI